MPASQTRRGYVVVLAPGIWHSLPSSRAFGVVIRIRNALSKRSTYFIDLFTARIFDQSFAPSFYSLGFLYSGLVALRAACSINAAMYFHHPAYQCWQVHASHA